MKTAFALTAALAATLAVATPALSDSALSPEDARAYILSPEPGATVTSPVRVEFGLEGMGIAPAGVEAENTGHHHLLVDISLDELDLENPLPDNENVRDYGGGQSRVSVELEPGEHTLQLLFADHNHVPHDPPVASEPITIIVE